MQELTDDQLDGLFRKATEEFEPEFDAAAWQAMQQQLNDRDKSLFWGKLLRWGITALVLLLVTGSSWYVYENRATKPGVVAESTGGSPTDERPVAIKANPPSNHSVKVSLKQPAPGKATTAPAQAEATPTDTPEPDRLTPLSERLARIERAPRTTPNPGSSTVARRSDVTKAPLEPMPVALASPTDRRLQSARLRKATYQREKTTTANTTFIQQNATTSGYSTPVTSRSDIGGRNSEPLIQEATLPVTLPGLATLASKPAVWSSADTLAQHEVMRPVVDVLTVTPPVKQTSLSVRLLVSPDLSSVGLKDFQRPGTNIGALVEYQFATRWRVQAGVIRSVKVYKSPASHYEWGSYTWAVQPESVFGRCNMLDIPLNLRYDFSLRQRPDGRHNSWFVSGGFTTYIMLREDYSYNYANPDDPKINARAREWTTSTGGYGFSHLNVSAGYERAFSKRLSWQVEPFFKIPLKGVGYYKLDLLSTGAFFSMRYKLR